MESIEQFRGLLRGRYRFTTCDGLAICALLRTYQDGNLAVELVTEDGEPYAMLSVNIPSDAHLLGEGEFFAKTWSENEAIAEDALASGLFANTRRNCSGVLNAQIWRVR